MVSFEHETRWIRVNGILPESLGESDSRIRVQLLTLNYHLPSSATRGVMIDLGKLSADDDGISDRKWRRYMAKDLLQLEVSK